MSNIIPPLLSDSPPPIVTADDEEDEFGDFNSAVEASYAYENLSLPSTPQHPPLDDVSRIKNFDINSNTNNIKNIEYKNHINGLFSMHIDKDFQDKRKSCDIATALTQTDVNLPKNLEETVNNVNSSKLNASSCSEEDSEKIHDGALPNESVPIDIATHNHLSKTNSESNVIPDVPGDLDLTDKNIDCSSILKNVPCSYDESLLEDDLKNGCNKDDGSALHAESSSYNSTIDKDTCVSNLDVNIVPNNCGATKKNTETTVPEILRGELYFIEEPPDLHVIDDSKVQVEDFHYYDAYDDHDNEKFSQGEYDNVICSYGDLAIVTEDITSLTDNCVKDCNGILDKSSDINLVENKLNPSLNEADNVSSISESKYSENIIDEIEINDLDDIEFHESNNKNKSVDTEINLPTVDELKKQLNTIDVESNDTDTDGADVKKLNDTDIKNECCKKIDENTDFSTSNFDDKEISFNKEENLKCVENNDINDFDLDIKNDTLQEESHIKEDEVDSFCNITTLKENYSIDVTVIESNNIELEEESKFESFNDFAEFDAKFSEDITNSFSAKTDSNETESLCIPNDEEDEFGDFGDYTKSNLPDSESFHSETSTLSIPKINKEAILENVDKIIMEMYPTCDVSCDEFVSIDVLQSDSVFKSAKDVTGTHALTYQWTKSTSQDKLLSALNIDTRNILYGPGWNPMMPKYAANLGLTPLEPVKSTGIASTSSVQSGSPNLVESVPSTTVPVDIPSAQFDWSGSGLINPLDCQPKDAQRTSDQEVNLDQLEKSADTLTPVLRARFHSDNESVKSLQLSSETIQDPEEVHSRLETAVATFENDFDEFASYQSPKPTTEYSQWSTTHVPLRETRICTEQTSEASPQSITKSSEVDEEFSDFQMSIPSPVKLQNQPDKSKTVPPDYNILNPGSILQPVLEPLKPTLVAQKTQESTQINWPDPGICDEDILNLELTYSRKESQQLEESKIKEGVKEVSIPKVAKTTKPDVWNNNAQKSSAPSNFPDLVLVNKTSPIHNTQNDNQQFSRQAKNHSKPMGLWATSNRATEISPAQTPNRSNNDDEDDWSDFVCNPAPMKPTSCVRSTPSLQAPELRLSVPHLSQLQQPKKPIPVITPQGLIQTRIPSNISNLSNLSVQQPSSLFQNQVRDTFQPSIISHQYQNHINGPPFNRANMNGFYNRFAPQQVPFNQSLPNNIIKSTNADDDDDWTDFISSPPLQTGKKPASVPMGNASRTNIINNSNVGMPNIITNPVHFDSSTQKGKSSFGPNPRNARKSTNNVNFGGPATIPSISALPDLDFIAPKSKTFTKK